MGEATHETRAGRLRGSRALVVAVAAALLALVVVAAVAARIGTTTLTLPAAELAEQRAHGTWSDMFVLERSGATAVAAWVLALLAAGLLGLPYAWLAARALPDRGLSIARTVGLLLVTLVVWWLASLRVLAFTRVGIAAAVLLVAGGGAAIAWMRRAEMREWLRSHWRLLLLVEAVFWTLFAAALFVRWSNPDLWHAVRGGEKPMDFAELNAVAKSTSFPPFDPWFADGQLNYYYLGYVQVAALAKTTAIPPAVAYNLAVPTLAALLGSGAFCATLGLVARTRAAARWHLAVAGLAAIFATVVGNLAELRVLRDALRGPVPNDWWFWNASRAIRAPEGEPGPITEFPAFTFIYGDLHAHAMALPLAALALALTVAYVRARAVRWRLASVALLGVTVGMLWGTNSWDVPTYGLVALAGIAVGCLAVDRGVRALRRLALDGGLFVATAYLSVLPYQLRYESVFDGVQRWRGGRTSLVDYLTVHGLFLFLIVSALVARIALSADANGVSRSLRLLVRGRHRLDRVFTLRRALVRPSAASRYAQWGAVAVVALALVLIAAGQAPAGVAALVALLALLAWPRRRQPLQELVLLLVLLGLALSVSVEYVVLRNIDIGRTNTVFKLYLQVWLLWAVAAAVAVGTVYEHLPRVRRPLREAWRVAFVLLFASALLYSPLAARAKIADRFDTSVGRTLDGTAFMRRAVLDDAGRPVPLGPDRDAIRWLVENVHGSPVVAEVNTTPTLYGWQARYAVHTGNPTIVGWDFHERQQRPSQSDLVQRRVEDVQTLYRTTDPALAHRVLRRYDAAYVVDGPLERTYFPEGAAKWAAGAGRYWTLAYANSGVRIYRVLDGTR